LNGSVDPDFSAEALPDMSWPPSVSIDSENRIYVLGYRSNTLVRLMPNGTLDRTFQHDSESEKLRTIAVDAEGRLLIHGSDTSSIARLNEDGSIDNGFDNSTHPSISTRSIRPLPNGTILLDRIILTSDGSIEPSGGSGRFSILSTTIGNRYAETYYNHTEVKSIVRVNSFEGTPQIARQPRDVEASIGSSLTLSIEISDSKAHFVWKHNGETVDGENSRILTIPDIGKSNEGVYSVTMIWADGQLELPEFTVSTRPASNTQPPPVYAYEATPNGLEFTWDTSVSDSFELYFSKDVQTWQLAPVEVRINPESRTATVPHHFATDAVFLRLQSE
jgi:hypothetical protein